MFPEYLVFLVHHAGLAEEVLQLMADAFVHRAGVALGGEDFAVVAGAVLAHHFLVEGVVVAHGVDAAYVVVGVGVVDLAVQDAVGADALAEASLLGREAEGEGDDGHHPFGAMQQGGNLGRVVHHGAEVAEAQAASLGGEAEVLGEEAGVDQGGHHPQQVAVGLVALVDLAVAVVAVHIGADGEQQGGGGALVKVEFQQLGAQGFLASGDDAVELHVARVGGTQATLHQLGEQGVAHRLVGESAYATVPQHELYRLMGHKLEVPEVIVVVLRGRVDRVAEVATIAVYDGVVGDQVEVGFNIDGVDKKGIGESRLGSYSYDSQLRSNICKLNLFHFK